MPEVASQADFGWTLHLAAKAILHRRFPTGPLRSILFTPLGLLRAIIG